MAKKKKRKDWKIVLGILLFLLVLVIGVGTLLSDSETKPETKISKTLNAKIEFTGTQFIFFVG